MGVSALALLTLAAPAAADDRVYADFPVTVKGYAGAKTTSVSYGGQIARHALHDSLKKLVGAGDAAAMAAYFTGSDAGRAIVAPATKGKFVVAQSSIDEISEKKNLAGKTYKGGVTGMPNGMTGAELIAFWLEKAGAAENGVDLSNGYDYPQLVSKFIMGAVFYNQVVDGYLDENLAADKKPNDRPYAEGAAYTGKEHSWDEAFGYFGAPAHVMRLTPQQVYDIAQQKEDVVAAADLNNDGKIDLKTEMTFAPAYYAAGFDASVHDKGDDATAYLHTIAQAFLDGREIIVSARGEKLTDAQRGELRRHAAVIQENWERVFAEAIFKYAGAVYKDMEKLQTIIEAKGDPSKALASYVKHWGEMKGFSLAIQTGKANLGETATGLNRMIGFGPLLPNLSQVVDIDRSGGYVRDQGVSWGEYMVHMAKVQKLMVDTFGVKAKTNAIAGDVAALSKALGAPNSAEND